VARLEGVAGAGALGGDVDVDVETRERLRALGYFEDE
jgi:hypothetical protein